MRAILVSPSFHGIGVKVSGSGIATMSDSSIALKPVIDEPSKPMPSSSAASISLGVTAKLFRCPSMSVNQRRRNSIPSSAIRFSTCLRASGSLVARAVLSTCATRPPFKKHESPGRSRARGRIAYERRSVYNSRERALCQHPEKCRLVLGPRLVHRDDLLDEHFEAGVADVSCIRLCVPAREEHLDPEPRLRPVGTADD